MKNYDISQFNTDEFTEILRQSLILNRFEYLLTEDNADIFNKLCRLAYLALEFNSHTNITAISDPSDLALSHIVDSITIARFVPRSARVADIGCGGGFPTLPLAILRPDVTISAVDSTAKKLNFVLSAANELKLTNVGVFCARAEEAASVDGFLLPSGEKLFLRERFDFVTARAVAALPILCELCLPCVKVGGVFCAMKGPKAEDELADSKKAIATLGGTLLSTEKLRLTSYDSTFTIDRNLVIIKKLTHTLERYPRAFGKIKKSPL